MPGRDRFLEEKKNDPGKPTEEGAILDRKLGAGFFLDVAFQQRSE